MLHFFSVMSNGRLAFSEVLSFLEKKAAQISKYKSITTSSNTTIQLSGNHLMYAQKGSKSKYNAM